MLIFSTLLYLLLALLITVRIYGVVSFSRVVVFFFLVTVALNILVSEILSLLTALGQPWFFILTQSIVCLAAGFLLWDRRKWFFKQALPDVKLEGIRPRGLDWMLLTLISAVFVLSLYIGSLVPINNSDSLHTHLPRIYYWIQHGSLKAWDAVTITQINKPVNLSLQGLWLFLLGGSEKLFFLATWYALLAAIVLIYNIARQLGATYRGALFAALMSLSFPVILLQTFSYQADVFVSTLGLASVALLLEYLREKRTVALFLSLVAMALALGSKNTAFFILPFYILVVVIHFIRDRVKIKRFLVFGGVFVLLFGIFLSYNFVQNYQEGGRIDSIFALHRFINPEFSVEPGQRILTNTLRHLYQGISFDGLTGRWKLGAENIRAGAFRSLSERSGVDLEAKKFISMGDAETFSYDGLSVLNEDASWYGPLSFILIPITCLVVLFGKNKTRKRYLLGAFVFLTAVFVVMSVLITGWSPTNGRYLIMPTLVISPLLFVLLPERRVAGTVVTVVFSLCAAYLAFSSLLINDAHPLITQSTLYTYQQEKLDRSADAGLLSRAYTYINDRVIEDLALTSPDRKDIKHQDYYANLFHQSVEDIPDVVFVSVHVPPEEPLYVIMQKSLIEYALFGVNKTRELHPVKKPEQVPAGALVLVDKQLLDEVPAGMQLIAENEHYRIMRKD